MKKALLVLLFSGMAMTAQAGTFYVQGDLGATYQRGTNDASDLTASSMHQRLSVGYQYNDNWRFAIDYTNYGKAKQNLYVSGYGDVEYSNKISSLGLSAIYDFSSTTDLIPYLGLRLSSNTGKENANVKHYSYRSYSESTTVGGAAVLGGLQYKLTDKVKLNAGLEFGAIGSNLSASSANVGLRYDF